jgi:error-prone DNA polymerase
MDRVVGAQLHVHSAFSFLSGVSTPPQLVKEAARLDIGTLALTDTFRLSGIPSFLEAAHDMGIKAIVGAEVSVENLGKLVLLVPETSSYVDLTRLLTESLLSSPRRHPLVRWETLERYGRRLIALTGDRWGILPRLWLSGRRAEIPEVISRLKHIFGVHNLFIELTVNYLPGDRLLFQFLNEVAQSQTLRVVATSAAHYARKQDFGLFDLMTCIRTGQRIEETSPERYLNAENYLKPWAEMKNALRSWPDAIRNTEELAERLQTPDILHQLHYPRFPDVPVTMSAPRFLAHLVQQGAKLRYGARTAEVQQRIRHELAIIEDMGFIDYFLVVWDVARFARSRGIRFAGRGSAADSVVAYCLYITDVDAYGRQLLFERFMSRERQETPDIDIDFDAIRRDEVADYVRHKYGADRVAQVATYQTFRARSAVREIGKALAFPSSELDALAKSLPERSIDDMVEHWEEIPELRQYPDSERLKLMLNWARHIIGLPRHVGTHLGGLVLSRDSLDQVSPREWSEKGVQIIQFDKRDIELVGLLKLDLLSLRTFTAVNIAVNALAETDATFSYDTLPHHDTETFQRLNRGEAIGVFQLESPAQRSLAQRLHPDRWEDIVASLALIRPGPIKGNMVDPFIARRQGKEPVTYLHPDLEPILSKTYGVVLFQEQVIAIASTLAGFTLGEADALRRIMTHGRSPDAMEELGVQFRKKAVGRGVEPHVAEAVFQQIVGYASYGFNEAHAAAFAETAYRTAYLLEHHPREYFLGLLNAEPLGYYPIDVLLVEARRRGIEIRPMDINRSQVDATMEDPHALRIGLRFLRHLGGQIANALVVQRPPGGWEHPIQIAERIQIGRDQLQALVQVGAFDAITPDRDGLLRDLAGNNRLGLTSYHPGRQWTFIEQVAWDYKACGFGQRQQGMAPWRLQLDQDGYLPIHDVKNVPAGHVARTVGHLIRPHRPPTRSGRLVVFFSLLDETGVLEARLSTTGYQKYGHLLFGRVYPILAVSGRIEPQGMDIRSIRPWVSQKGLN